MQFLFPWFFWAALAVAVPILIHLFYFRRFKQVYFTNVRFLKEVKEETSARSKLRNLLVLAARCLALLALVLGFVQPFIKSKNEVKQGEQAVSVFVDNSFSMSALSEEAPLVEKAKQRAREIVKAYAADDRFQILTNDFEGRHQRLVSKDDALNLIEEIKVSPATQLFSKVLQRQQQVLNTAAKDLKTAFIISDFQKNVTDLANFKDTLLDINLVPLQAVQEKNISIDSCWFESPVPLPNQINPLLVRMSNHSNEVAKDIRLALRYDGQAKPVGSFEIPARSSRTDTVKMSILRTGWHEAELSITDFPVQFDDKYLFSFEVPKEINVLIINENTPNKFMESAFAGAGAFKVTSLSSRNLDYSKLSTFRLIILNELNTISSGLGAELLQYSKNGGNVMLFPSGNASDLTSYRNFFTSFQANDFSSFEAQQREVESLNSEEFVFKDVFEKNNSNVKLPVTKGNFKINEFRAVEKLLTYRDGSTFLSKYRADKGNLYVCSAPLDEQYSNLVRNGEIFIPMLYKMAISSAQNRQISYFIGKDVSLETDNVNIAADGGETNYRLKSKTGEFIPEQKLLGSKLTMSVQNQIKEADFYDLMFKQDSVLSKFAFNYDRRESALDYFSEKELQNFARKNLAVMDSRAEANFTNVVSDRNQGIVLWKWCLIFALLFLGLETLLLRFWKV